MKLYHGINVTCLTQLVPKQADVDGGEIYYALGDENGPLESYITLLSTATEAGEYYVWYNVVGDENHKDSEEFSAKAVIEAADEESSESTPDSIPDSSEAESTADESSKADSKADASKADSSSKAAAAATTSNPATGAAAAGMGAASLAAAALIVAKKKDE